MLRRLVSDYYESTMHGLAIFLGGQYTKEVLHADQGSVDSSLDYSVL